MQEVRDQLGWFSFDAVADKSEILTPEQWRYWVTHFGGAPAHLTSSTAFQQVTEIAQTVLLGCNDGDGAPELWPAEAMIGVAWMLCKAVAAGRKISSLGFIAIKLARMVEDCDTPGRGIIRRRYRRPTLQP
jgi:hypothetical protein